MRRLKIGYGIILSIKNLKSVLLISLMLTGLAEYTLAQDDYSVKSHIMIISGTSNVHDWTAQVFVLKGLAKIGDAELTDISITVDTKTLKSSKGTVMDNKMYDALNTDKFPKIYYKSNSKTLLSLANKETTPVSTKGEVTISGTTKNITVSGIYKKTKNEEIIISGSFSLLMTDFGIKPPTALFGILKTGNRVEITYKIHLKKKGYDTI